MHLKSVYFEKKEHMDPSTYKSYTYVLVHLEREHLGPSTS